jgi:hypothetical protein
VIGGEVAAVEKAEELLQAAGTKRMISLNVSGQAEACLQQSSMISAGVFITATIFPLPVGAASLINWESIQH